MPGIDPDFWAGRRVLLSGHTGFKGAWLSLWLQSLGARVTGLAPGPPTRPSLYDLAKVGAGAQMRERAIDVRDADGVREALREARPEVVLHLAAQPLVRRSLRDPATTYMVNVIGTVNVLEAVRQVGGEVRAVVVVTSDKCYENLQSPSSPARRFVEDDPLGGDDPYSSSKACAELVTAAYRRSFFAAEDRGSSLGQVGARTQTPGQVGARIQAPGQVGAPIQTPARAGARILGRVETRIASARAGNVIGGGDWGEDRLIGDIVRAMRAGTTVKLRNPEAVRPWQHVLNPLSGYLRLAEELWRSRDAAEAWNFGPRADDARTVRWIVERLRALWGDAFEWELDGREHPPEASHLALDSGKAERRLGWRAEWDLAQALERVVEWHEAERRGQDMRRVSLEQIERFERAPGQKDNGAHKT